MCGLFGSLSTYLTTPEIAATEQLAFLSALRGLDSTGIALGYKKKGQGDKFGIYTHKMLLSSPDYLRHKDTREILKDLGPCFMIGHTRAATIGDVNIDNAHPHQAQHIVGVHNGTIGSLGNKEKSDSRELFELLAEQGVQKAFSKADSGAYATVFADVRARTVNFFRNDKRPLYLMWTKTGGTLYWASEKEMLDLMAARTQWQFEEPWMLKPHTLYSIPFGKVDPKVTDIKIETPSWVSSFPRAKATETTHIAPAPVIPPRLPGLPNPDTRQFKQVWDNINNCWKVERNVPEKNTSKISEPVSKTENQESNVPVDGRGIPLLHEVKGPKRYDDQFYKVNSKTLIPTGEAELILAVGCATCGTPHTLDDDSISWKSTDTFICEKCEADPQMKIIMGPTSFGSDIAC